MDKAEIDGLKSRFDLVEYISRDLGQEGKGGRWVSFKCPFHEDRNPSFIVSREKQYCVCCSQGCNMCDRPMDIIAYVMARMGLDFISAMRHLGADMPMSAPRPRPRTKKKMLNFKPKVLQLLPFQEKASAYFSSRHILDYIIERDLFSMDPLYTAKASYEMLDGYKITFKCPRFIIPDHWFDQVRGVNGRRNDAEIARFMQHSADMLDHIREDMFLRNGEEPSDEELIEAVFGPKFKFWAGSSPRLFNANRIVTKSENGELVYPRLGYLMVVEAGIDAHSLESATEEAGYPTVAAESMSGLELAFRKISRLVIVSENDRPKKRYDGSMSIAGEDFADRVVAASKHPNCDVIFPPDDHKDSNDVVSAGKVKSWLEPYDILPVEREYLDMVIERARAF